MNQTTHDYWSFPSTLSWNGRNHIAVSARSYQCLRPHNLPSFMNHGSGSRNCGLHILVRQRFKIVTCLSQAQEEYGMFLYTIPLSAMPDFLVSTFVGGHAHRRSSPLLVRISALARY
jgi:hypothetical protein